MLALKILLKKFKSRRGNVAKSLYWGDFWGHSVAIVSNREKKLDIEKKINLKNDNNLENIVVMDGSFWQVNQEHIDFPSVAEELKASIFIGSLSDYAKHWNKKYKNEDSKLFFELAVLDYDIWKDWI